MNILPLGKQAQIISLFAEGNSIRAINRLTGVAKNTVMSLGYRVGRGCAELHDQLMVNISPARIEVDEIWSFIKKRPPRSFFTSESDDVEEANTGARFTFMCLAANERAIVSYWTGRKDSSTVNELLSDLRERIDSSPEFSSDGFAGFQSAIRQYFGAVNYGQVIKNLDIIKGRQGRLSPFPGRALAGLPVERKIITGLPTKISTGRIERFNLTVRTTSSRFRRGTNAFSKKLEHHAAAVNLCVFHYNFLRIHKALKTAPAVAIGIAPRPWAIEELVERALEEFCHSERRDTGVKTIRSMGPVTYSEMFQHLADEKTHHETMMPHVSADIASHHKREAEVCEAIADVLSKYRERTKGTAA